MTGELRRRLSEPGELRRRLSEPLTWKYGMEVGVHVERRPSGELSVALNKELDRALLKVRPTPALRRATREPSIDFKDPIVEKKKFRRNSVVKKATCGLCGLSFAADSVVGRTCQKHISEFRIAGGENLQGRRFETASFNYQAAKLCVFCTQLLGDPDKIESMLQKKKHHTSDDASVSSTVGALHEIIAAEARFSGKAELEALEEEERHSFNAALRRPAFQSSTVDGRAAVYAVDGTESWSCTRREYEAWWEVDLDSIVVDRVTIQPLKRSIAPAVVMIAAKPLGRLRLHDARKHAVAELFIHDGDTVLCSWDLPKGTKGGCLRVQVRGTKALQLSDVVVERGCAPDFSQPPPIDDAQTALMSSSEVTFPVQERPRTSPIKKTAGLSSEYYCRGDSVVLKKAQPSDVELSRVATAKRLPLHVASGLRRCKSPSAEFASANPVDELYWRAVLRYERKHEAQDALRALEKSFTKVELDWTRKLFAASRKFQATANHDALEQATTNSSLSSRQVPSFDGTVDGRAVYTCLRALSESLSKQSGPDLPFDGAAVAMVAKSLGKFLTGDHSLSVGWRQFLGLLGVAREQALRDTDHPLDDSEVAAALLIESEPYAVDPLGVQRRADKDRSQSIPLERPNTGTPTIDLRRGRPETVPTRLRTAEWRFHRVKARSDRPHEVLDYRGSLEKRRQRQRLLTASATSSKLVTFASKNMVERRNCALCQYKFPVEHLTQSVSQEHVVEVLRSFGKDIDCSGRFRRTLVCRFCSQFFDDGVPTCRRATSLGSLEPFFDSQYPDNTATESHFTAVNQRARTASATIDNLERRRRSLQTLLIENGGDNPLP